MLQLKDIVKDYGSKDFTVHALKGINLNFRDNEFVAILGQSGCGKTTMLNIVGGLDRYTSGDLIIDGISTKKYQDVDWDAYRNVRIGFIFQSYNLISHIDILANVEMALTLSGVPTQERKERAIKALESVGLKDQLHKKPNQLSGGQMQRVSIARALINNPDIILADEPTGALDSATSIQVMDILKEIAKDRLVIMVTHNPELAEKYATRIVKLSDGEVIDDSMPYNVDDVKDEKIEDVKDEKIETSEEITKKDQRKEIKEKKKKLAKTSMSFITALHLSFNNLLTKRTRTILTAIAGSIGIIGLSLVLAVSNGFSKYVDSMEKDMMSGYPVTIEESSVDYTQMMSLFTGTSSSSTEDSGEGAYPDDGIIKASNTMDKLTSLMNIAKKNTLSDEYVEYLSKMDSSLYGSIYYKYNMNLNVIGKPRTAKFIGTKTIIGTFDTSYGEMVYSGEDGDYQNIISMTSLVSFNEITGNEEFITSQYDCLYGKFPTSKNQIILVVNSKNEISDFTLEALGIDSSEEYTFEDIIKLANETPLKAYANDEYYYDASTSERTLFKANNATELYISDKECVELEVVGIFRNKQDVSYSTLTSGICYTSELVEYLLEKNMTSQVAEAQRNNKNQYVIYEGNGFPGSASDSIGAMFGAGASVSDQSTALSAVGGKKSPSSIYIYPSNFDCKETITAYLDAWNNEHEESEQVTYNDMAALISSMLSQMIKIVTIALTCFSSISLVVSSFMIGIITYVSVVERTKEIGILRSLGARKKDISRVFNAETLLIGFAAGVFGILVTYILSIPINLIVNWKADMVLNLCNLNPLTALAMVALSMVLTFIAGLIPSRYAANRDPVIALRTE